MKKYSLKVSCFLIYFSILELFINFNPTHSEAQNYLDLAGLSPYTHYLTFDTEHFHLIYPDGYFGFASRAAEHLEHAHEVLSPILKWQPRSRTSVLIADNEDNANGFTLPALRVGIVLIATPPENWFSTSYSEDWIKLLTFHEYTHFLNMDATRGWVEVARLFFGDLIRPNSLWPTWMLEGLAVFFETRTSQLGRGRSPYYDAILRAYLIDNRLGSHYNRGMTLDRVNGKFPYFPGGEIPYLFGYHLWNEFSKDRTKFTDTDAAMGELSWRSAGRFPYFIEGNLENVMGRYWKDYWNTFLESSTKHLSSQIEQIKKAGESKYEFLSHSLYSSHLGAISPNGQWLAYSESALDDQTRLILLNLKTGETRKLNQKTLGLGMSFTPNSKHLIFSSLVRTHTYSLFSDLFIYDLDNNQTSPLSIGLRGKDPSLSEDGRQIVFIQSEKATHLIKLATLVNENGKYHLSEVRTLYAPKEFTLLGTPKFLNDHEVIFSRQEIGKPQSDLVAAHVITGAARVLLADGAMNRFPSVQYDHIYFVSDRNGVDNVFALPISGGTSKNLTNVITGAAFPIFAPDRTLYGSLLTSDGYEIVHFLDTLPVNLSEKLEMPSAPAPLLEALKEPLLHLTEEHSKNYSPWSSLAPRQWAPISLLTYNNNAGLTWIATVLGFDTSGKHQYFGYAGYNFKPQTVDGAFSYTYYGFRPLISLAASSVTTDIGTDIDHAQYRTAAQTSLTLSYPISFTYSHLVPSIYGFASWNRVYDLSSKRVLPNQDFEYSRPLVPSLGGSFIFTDAEQTKLGFVPESGNNVALAVEDRINVGNYSVVKYLALYDHYFNLGEHFVLIPKAKWIASTHPTGFDHSFARIQGKNSSDINDRGLGLNLNRIGLRGYADAALYTRQTAVGGLDFHFPISKPFSGAGDTTPFFLKQLHGFVFAESAYIPSSRYANLFLPSFGGGLSLDTQVLIQAPIRINFEVQNGTRTDFGGNTLFFVSLDVQAF